MSNKLQSTQIVAWQQANVIILHLRFIYYILKKAIVLHSTQQQLWWPSVNSVKQNIWLNQDPMVVFVLIPIQFYEQTKMHQISSYTYTW